MISQNIQTLRASKQITQEELAEHIGVSRQTIAKWESGDSIPDMTNGQALANYFDVRLDDLVNHSQQKTGMPCPPAGLHIFGVVSVGERGQIVIPKKAREVFDIKPGSELLMLGDEERGLALVSTDSVLATISPFTSAISAARNQQKPNDLDINPR